MGNCAIRRGLVAAAGLLAVGLGAVLFRPADAAPPATTAAPARAGFDDWRGVSSCTSSSCHNQDARRTGDSLKGREYAVWLARDPHARAYQVLFDDQSVGIQKQLHQLDPLNEPIAASCNRLCLRCHVAPEAEDIGDAAPTWFSDGVGCESCHGAAGRWLAGHRRREWTDMAPSEKKSWGFQDTKDLTVRADKCMACHVGGDRAEVNHDLLAVGHPPLQFEFSSFLDRYRAYQHWSEADDRRRDPAYEADAWAVGQASAARAALRLLALRAERAAADPDARQWPEFAEYTCSSCHHALKGQPTPTAVGHQSGMPAWSWYTAMTPMLPEPPAGAIDDLSALRQAMEDRNPNPACVAAKAARLAGAYDVWLKAYENKMQRRRSEGVGGDELRKQLWWLTGDDGAKIAGRRWEDARQLSFAVSAYYRSLESIGSTPRSGAAVLGLADDLRPACGQDTPSGFDPDRIRQRLEEIHHVVGP